MQGVELYGDNWTMVEEFVGTRNTKQILNFAQKHFENQYFTKQNLEINSPIKSS